ncbi:MAG TPA: hypothetical protein VNG51_07030 [Ktedonobacteraceae bacterium]|nr:hypothetical protein [Ktedonobacteraceae bacterium]
MSKQPTREQRLAREKALHRYMDAFERDDFDTMSQVLAQAEQDPELENLIWEVHAAYAAEEEVEQREHDVEQVQQLLRHHLPSGWEMPVTIEDMPPLTIGDVAARMQADEAVRGSVKQELNSVMQRLHQSNTMLPENLGIRSVRDLFTQLGVQASKQLQKLFSETSLFLRSGRQQGMAQLAATRRQREQSLVQEKQQTEPTPEEQQKPAEEEGQ